MSSGGLWSWPSRPCEWPAKRLRGRPVSRTVTLRRARPSCRAPARPAKLPPMMMTSSMVMGSVLWMEGVGLGLARNIVERYAFETGSEQGFGIGEKVAHDCVDRPDDAAFIECIISEQPAVIPRHIMLPPIMPWLILPVLLSLFSRPAVSVLANT